MVVGVHGGLLGSEGSGRGWSGSVWSALAVGVYAGLLLSVLAVCLTWLISLSLLATVRGGPSFLGP